MKPFEMPQARNGVRHVAMERRSAVTGKISVMRLAQGPNVQEPRDAAARVTSA